MGGQHTEITQKLIKYEQGFQLVETWKAMIGLLLMKENVFFGFFPHPESSSPQSHPVLEIPRGEKCRRFRNAALDTKSAALNCSLSLQPHTRAPPVTS